jgi:hypothetical protein
MERRNLRMNYDRWKLSEGPTAVIVCECDYCQEPIQEGEDVYKLDSGDTVHEDCFNEYAKEVLGAIRTEA